MSSSHGRLQNRSEMSGYDLANMVGMHCKVSAIQLPFTNMLQEDPERVATQDWAVGRTTCSGYA